MALPFQASRQPNNIKLYSRSAECHYKQLDYWKVWLAEQCTLQVVGTDEVRVGNNVFLARPLVLCLSTLPHRRKGIASAFSFAASWSKLNSFSLNPVLKRISDKIFKCISSPKVFVFWYTLSYLWDSVIIVVGQDEDEETVEEEDRKIMKWCSG